MLRKLSFEQKISFIVLLILGIAFIIPLTRIILTSLMVDVELQAAGGFMLFPETWTLYNFIRVLDPNDARAPIVRWFMNSVFVSVIFTVISVKITAMSAFAFSKLQFKGRDVLFLAILFVSSFPAIVTIVPLFYMMRVFGWLNTSWALIFPGLVGVFNIFLTKQFMLGIPDELLEAARMDGAGDIRIFYQIMLPLLKPILAIIAIFSFTFIWNDFFWPGIAINDIDRLTLTAGLQLARGTYWHFVARLSAAAVVAIVPMIFLYLFFEKWFIRGVSISAGIKG